MSDDMQLAAERVRVKHGVRADWITIAELDVLRVWITRVKDGHIYTAYTYVSAEFLADDSLSHYADAAIEEMKALPPPDA